MSGIKSISTPADSTMPFGSVISLKSPNISEVLIPLLPLSITLKKLPFNPPLKKASSGLFPGTSGNVIDICACVAGTVGAAGVPPVPLVESALLILFHRMVE